MNVRWIQIFALLFFSLSASCTCGPTNAVSSSVSSSLSSVSSAPSSALRVPPDPTPILSPAQDAGTIVEVVNDAPSATTVYIAFGSDSVVLPSSPGWSFCIPSSQLNCSFSLNPYGKERSVKNLPLYGKYLNATFSFDAPVGCDVTKAELNVNNPDWYNTVDVSLVDGFSNFVAVDMADVSGNRTFGPPNGPEGNENLLGVFPNGCDVCVARRKPPCGKTPGKAGCKAGTQFAPTPPCQVQGAVKGGSGWVVVRLMAGVPAKR